MRSFLLALVLTVSSGPAVVLSQDAFASSPSAQEHAERIAASGQLQHCSRRDGTLEGIGFSTVSADAAIQSCCFYRDAMKGRYRIVERGVARGRRGWFAVVRYSSR